MSALTEVRPEARKAYWGLWGWVYRSRKSREAGGSYTGKGEMEGVGGGGDGCDWGRGCCKRREFTPEKQRTHVQCVI